MTDCPPTSYGPCQPLATVDDLVCGCGLDLNLEANRTLLDTAMLWASRRTMMATRYRFMGCCTSVIRPEPEPCDPHAWFGQHDVLVNGRLSNDWGGLYDIAAIPLQVAGGPTPTFINCWSCACGQWGCDHIRPNAIALPYLPVRDVVEVKIDGLVIDPAFYRVVPHTNLLERVDGYPWPDYQSDQADTEVGTWSVTFRHSLDLPIEAKPLVAGYGCQLAKRCKGLKCDLAEGIKVVSRPGVDYAVLDASYREQGLTGYEPLDDWIIQMFGGHAKTRPHMVDMNRRHRRSVLQ